MVGFLAWIIIGPPVSSYLLDGQVSTLVLSIKDNFLGFFVPILMSIIFFHLSEMYRSMSRFYDPVKHLTANFIGSLIFGLSWSGIYLYKVDQYAADISVIIILQGLVLSLVFFSLTSAIRLVAKIILNPYKININHYKIIIYPYCNRRLPHYYKIIKKNRNSRKNHRNSRNPDIFRDAPVDGWGTCGFGF